MNSWIKILVAIPTAMMLSQCMFLPWGTGFVDGTVYDGGDGYPLAGVYVEVLRYPGCDRCPRTHTHGGSRVAHAVTDYEGYFACEFPLEGGYHYELVMSRVNYYTNSVPLGFEPDIYIEIDLVPRW